MPELPEVQTVVADLVQAGIVGTVIESAQVFWNRTIFEPDVDEFRRAITGQKILELVRRGKFIVARLSSAGSLLIHLRMSGRLYLTPAHVKRQKHEHVLLRLNAGQDLRFHDTRKFGRFYLVADAQTILGRLGPEPLSRRLTSAVWSQRLASRARMIKPLLLDQQFIAGVGNIYADEALWAAGIHPCQKAAYLSKTRSQRLYRSLRKALRQGIQRGGTSLGKGAANFRSANGQAGTHAPHLQVFRRTGEPCHRCGTRIQRIQVAQRSSHICPLCQKTTAD